MLQHNAAIGRQQAHLAHAAVVGLHAVCCGLPTLAMLAAGIASATAGLTLLSERLEHLHALLHAHELWILLVSAVFVATGAALELRARQDHSGLSFPWLFSFSVLCFFVNVAVFLAHRG